MSSFRKDWLLPRWVIIAEGREGRPNQFRTRAERRTALVCPFCLGHEGDTPPAVTTYGGSQTIAWQVRVIPNKYPAVEPGAGPPPAAHRLAESQPAFGVHEIIIEAPQHVVSFTELTDDQATWVFTAYRDRLRALRGDPRLAHALIFKNVGPQAGASLEHVHSQLLALPMVPREMAAEIAACRAHVDRHAECAFCRLMDEERRCRERWVAESHGFVCLCPYASRQPYEMYLLPKQHAARFEELETSSLAEAAQFVQQMLRALESQCPGVSYNYLLHSAPFDSTPDNHYHWHLEIIPRLTHTAGFEWGTGYYINPVAPERAAEELRRALAKHETFPIRKTS